MIDNPLPLSRSIKPAKGTVKTWIEEYNQIAAAITKPRRLIFNKTQIKQLEDEYKGRNRQLIAVRLRLEYGLNGEEIGEAMNISTSAANGHIGSL